MVRPVALGLIGDAGLTVPECGVAALRLVPAAFRQRHPHPGEAGYEEVGVRPGLPELHQEHSPSLAVAQILTLLNIFSTVGPIVSLYRGMHTRAIEFPEQN